MSDTDLKGSRTITTTLPLFLLSPGTHVPSSPLIYSIYVGHWTLRNWRATATALRNNHPANPMDFALADPCWAHTFPVAASWMPTTSPASTVPCWTARSAHLTPLSSVQPMNHKGRGQIYFFLFPLRWPDSAWWSIIFFICAGKDGHRTADALSQQYLLLP